MLAGQTYPSQRNEHMKQRMFHIVGILNVTPDSYHDGGRFCTVEQAIERAGVMLAEGADVIEVGGESTGPGSENVSVEEELERTIPVIRAVLDRYPETVISIDTYKSPVASEAIGAGAMMVNDITAGRADPKMLSTVAGSNTQIVLMYAKDPTPRTTIMDVQYDDVIRTIMAFLCERKEAAVAAGIDSGCIIIDPGLGHFVSSDPQYSFQIIRELERFGDLQSPLLLSPSRKSFLAGPKNLPAAERLPATIVASAIAVMHGATYIRTHDVAAVKRGCEAIKLLAPH